MRRGSAGWLVAEIEKLAVHAEEGAAEDDEQAAEGDSDGRAIYEARAETGRHYATQLRRILRGETWDESIARSIREARR